MFTLTHSNFDEEGTQLASKQKEHRTSAGLPCQAVQIQVKVYGFKIMGSCKYVQSCLVSKQKEQGTSAGLPCQIVKLQLENYGPL